MKHRNGISLAIGVSHVGPNQEEERIRDLMRIMPRGRSSVLDIGARGGRISLLLTPYFDVVTALDLLRPDIQHRKIRTVQGDVTRLGFADNSFDVVLCAEVLEHIRPELLEKACAEIARVATHEVVVGVPFKQDLRVGRTVCRSCGCKNPPWGHRNVFDEGTLMRLFGKLEPVSVTFAGTHEGRTNAFSALLMDLAGNPWGTYDQEEECIHCGSTLVAPPARTVVQRVCSSIASFANGIQGLFIDEQPNWIHMVFQKGTPASETR